MFAALSVGICAFAAAGCNPMTAGQGDGDGTEQSGEITGEGTPETPDTPSGFDATVTAETWDAALHFEGVTNVSMRGTVVGAVSQGVINAISRLDGDKVYIRQSAGDMLDENLLSVLRETFGWDGKSVRAFAVACGRLCKGGGDGTRLES